MLRCIRPRRLGNIAQCDMHDAGDRQLVLLSRNRHMVARSSEGQSHRAFMNTSFFGELLQTISERGRALLARDRRGEASARSESLVELCEDLLSGRGEASGVALAREILTRYGTLTIGPRIAFFEALAQRFGIDKARMEQAIDAWQKNPSDKTASDVHEAAEPRRQELFRRLNLAPGGTAALVRMREQLMDALVHRDDLAALDA